MSAGRTREFDKQEALSKAMEVFWKKGYSGASLSELTASMGINKPSMYAAYGNKEALFCSALEHYLEHYARQNVNALMHSTESLPTRLHRFLSSVLVLLTDKRFPGGCFIATSTSEAGGKHLPRAAKKQLKQINANTQNAFCALFEKAKKTGEIDSSLDPKNLAAYLMTIQMGLAAMARQGVDKHTLNKVVERSLDTFKK